MERPEHIKRGIAITIIILFHLVGLVGLSLPLSRPLFLQLVPYHLLLMSVVIIFTHQSFDKKLMLFILLILVPGFIAEWIGIHKAWLFGDYVYGDTLGIKVSGVPLIIGANWFLLIYSTGVLMQRARLKSIWLRVITGAIILVLLDVLIEPVAIRFNYWHWADNVIPFKNYICWFLLSGLLLFVFEKFGFKKQSVVGVVLLAAQFVFFAVLFINQIYP
jgi:putative membrane protein